MTKRGQCHIIWVSQKGPDGSCSGLGVCGQVLAALNKGFAMISVTMFATVVGTRMGLVTDRIYFLVDEWAKPIVNSWF